MEPIIFKLLREWHNSFQHNEFSFWVMHTIIIIFWMSVGGVLAVRYNSKLVSLLDKLVCGIKSVFYRRR